MDMFLLCFAGLTVCVNCLVEQFAVCLGVVVILVLIVMVLFSVVRSCMIFKRLCMLCM